VSDLRWGDLLVSGDQRRQRIRGHHGNGVDGVEVGEHGRRLTVLFLEHAPEGLSRHNIRIDGPAGARPVHAVSVHRSVGEDRELEDRLIISLDRAGSSGAYRLWIVEPGPGGRPGFTPYRGIDPRYATASFVFDVDAPLPPIRRRAPSQPSDGQDISYLLRDWEGLRQLMLDRLAVTLPEFTERHIPDLWITLVELLAYVGDDLSYYEDAVATEAYVQTARRRISVRRHARLLGYRLHSGCAARAWVCVSVSAPLELPLGQIRFAAAGRLADGRPVLDPATLPETLLGPLEQYSPLPANPDLTFALRPEHNAIALWSWGEADSRLAIGATSAELVDGSAGRRELALSPGDVILLEETHQPPALVAADGSPAGDPAALGPPDPAHRQAVRLTAVRRLEDELYEQPLLQIHWAPEDRLRFELPVRVADQPACQALANAVLVAHGVSYPPETVELDSGGCGRLGRSGLSFSSSFPEPAVVAGEQARILRGLYGAWRAEIERERAAAADGTPLSKDALAELRDQLGHEELRRLGIEGKNGERHRRAARQAQGLAELLAAADRLLARRRRRLEKLAALADASGPLESVLVDELVDDWGQRLTAPLAASSPGTWGPAAGATGQDPRTALPLVRLSDGAQTWTPALDLLDADPSSRAFVVEVDDEQVANLRVSDAPPGGTLEARYRVGNGVAGNVVAEAINAILWTDATTTAGRSAAGAIGDAVTAVTGVRNPLPATGGVDPESVDAARMAMPGSFQDRQPRALTAADYAAFAAGLPGVRRAAAELRYTGALVVAEVAIQPTAGEVPHPALLTAAQRALESVRRIDHVVRVHAPRYRPLVIELEAMLEPDTIRAGVEAELATLLSDGWLADGLPALFNPERVDFGETVYASAVVAAVQDVDGVTLAELKRFEFLDDARSALSPTLQVGAMELVRLDNDPTHPENGYAVLWMEGGR
jgi:hypothetical protein